MSEINRRDVVKAVAVATSLVAIGATVVAQDKKADDSKDKKGKEATKENIEIEAKKQQKELAALPLDKAFEQMRICCSSPVPAGWIKVNDSWDPTSCGNPSSIVYNVCIIEKFSNKPVGSVMNVCASAPTPAGWVVVNTRWDPTACGHPSSIVQNIKQIKRVS